MVIQMADLLDALTVEENSAFPSVQLAGASKQQIREIVMNCLQAHGLQRAARKLEGGAS
jgi:ABC-type transporter Mla maintaining outer membrane lipid asymmetry ATPase subunit MlaF